MRTVIPAIALLLSTAPAQTQTDVEHRRLFPCQYDEVHNELDFMLGEWDITYQGRALAWIALEKDGANCLIREKYGVYGQEHEGAGLDYWDAEAGHWRRILVTSVGTIETFEGAWDGDRFVWLGREQRRDGSVVPEKVEIYAEGDAIINNIYQSEDGGESWVLRGAERRVRKSG